jgi:uncharacterized coiled-coil protein SlyX
VLQNAGYVIAIVTAVLGVAAVGGAAVYRWKSGGEKEALGTYRNAVTAYKEELLAVSHKNERLELKISEQNKVITAQGEQIASQGDQISMLSRMVTGVEAIGNLEKHIDARFQGVHDHINRLLGGERNVISESR